MCSASDSFLKGFIQISLIPDHICTSIDVYNKLNQLQTPFTSWWNPRPSFMPSMARRPKFASSQYSANMLVMRILDRWKMLDKSIEILFLAPCPHFLSPFNVPTHHVYSSCCFMYSVCFHIMFFIYLYTVLFISFGLWLSYHFLLPSPISFKFISAERLLSSEGWCQRQLGKDEGQLGAVAGLRMSTCQASIGNIFADSFR